ncbi:retron Ec78 anti-phage system effector ATPase PtuA [Aeromonas caviae]|uniref:retron Ec78 anti-phage system effector ATPase PtuA n=1 Tax=Aeromonas caviae TaxID=648 RepID=UPI002446A2BB|nr:retron Ec78 anti-phage system effector ATPase PtuA [Aeromonas caviae]MDH0306689.1 AAA family ATPase [Aeromonas caviae]
MNKIYKDHQKGIGNLTRSANKGVLISQYQLFEMYSQGKYVEQDDELSSFYFELMQKNIKDKKFNLRTLDLYNFRRFKKLDLDFEDNVTVLIGDNGSGKTSIVDAIAKLLSWFNNNLIKEDVVGRPITQTEINVDADDYATISATLELDKINYFEATLGRVAPGYTGTSLTEVVAIKQFASMYRKTAHNIDVILPLISYYSAERLSANAKNNVSEVAHSDYSGNRFDALNDAVDGKSNLDSFPDLYIELVNLAHGEESSETTELKKVISIMENSLRDIYGDRRPSEDDPFILALSQKKNELEAILNEERPNKYQRHLQSVNMAIETLVPDIKNIRVDRSTGKPRILLDNYGYTVNINQLSKGQRILVSLAGDIAYRLVKLNPDAIEPLKGTGIILIDEIELHLHPKWQQEVITGLLKTFPNIQFIITTHSPQVLSTVDKSNIRKISFNDMGELVVKTPTFQTKGVTSADILSRIMDINSTPENIQEAIWVKNFSNALIKNNKNEVEHYLEKIKKHFGVEHPVVVDCESQIRIHELKSKWSKGE